MTEEKRADVVQTTHYLCSAIKKEERLTDSKTDLNKIGKCTHLYEVRIYRTPTGYAEMTCGGRAGQLQNQNNHLNNSELNYRTQIREGDHMVVRLSDKPVTIKIQSKTYYLINYYSGELILRK